MKPLLKYLAEEIGHDHADGIISRREALRRLGLLGMSVAASTSILAACAKEAARRPSAPTATETPSPTSTASVATEEIKFPGPKGRELMGAWAETNNPRGAVLVIHENRGLNDQIRSVAGRLAGSGYSALAIDLLSEEGGTTSLGDSANATAALGKVPDDRFVADMKAALDELAKRTPRAKLAVTGFCFGGAMVWLLLHSGEPRLAAAVPFYGTPPDGPDFSGSKAAVLAIYGEQDTRVNATQASAKSALEKAGLEHEIVVFPNANHAFFNDTGPRYNAEAAQQAYARVLDWFGKHLG